MQQRCTARERGSGSGSRARSRATVGGAGPAITLIGRDTEILDCAYEGIEHTVLVDYSRNPELYERLTDRAAAVLPPHREGPGAAFAVGTRLNAFVRGAVSYDEDAFARALKQDARRRGKRRISTVDLVPLSLTIERGFGICYHQSLALGVVIRLLQRRGVLAGTVSMEKALRDSHTWIRLDLDGSRVAIDTWEDVVAPLSPPVASPFRHFLRLDERIRTRVLPGRLEQAAARWAREAISRRYH